MAFLSSLYIIATTLSLTLAQHGSDYSKSMGPVAFMWPPDREWGAAQDNTAPCGSVAGVMNRTNFPLVNGLIALVAQDESWSVQVAISFSNNPTTNNDFRTIIDATRIPEIDDGHMCYPVPTPNVTDNIKAGSNATLQLSYTSDAEEHRNQTFYACADISYVNIEAFTYQVPCFNATIEHYNVTDTSGRNASSTASAGAASTSGQTTTSQSSSAMGAGAIAGIVVGILVVALGSLVAGFLIWRKKQRQQRMRAQEASVRSVKWDETSTDTVDGLHSRHGKPGQDIVLSELRK